MDSIVKDKDKENINVDSKADNLVEFRNIVKKFPGVLALNRVNLTNCLIKKVLQIIFIIEQSPLYWKNLKKFRYICTILRMP